MSIINKIWILIFSFIISIFYGNDQSLTDPNQPSVNSNKKLSPVKELEPVLRKFQFVANRTPTKQEEQIAAAAAVVFLNGHYATPELNDQFSRVFFEEYFESLDPNRIYFLSSDLEEFSPFELILDDTIRKGDLTFPFMVYERFLQRVKERVNFVRIRLQEPFNFSEDETLILSRKNLPWPSSIEELNNIWSKRIKNELIILKLQQESAKQKRGESTHQETETDPDDPDTSQLKQHSPEEIILKRYENYYRLLAANDTYDVLENYLTQFMRTFDPHSAYLNWRSLEDFDIDMRLSLEGIGAVLTSHDGYTQIVRIIPGGPCAKDGRLKPGDRILGVGQENEDLIDIFGMPLQKVVRLIRGPKGTTVRLMVQRPPNGVPFELKLVRDEVKLEDAAAHGEIKSVKIDNIESNILYIYLPSFYADWNAMRAGNPSARSASKDVKEIIDKARKQDKIVGILLDLRGNGGGSLSEAVDLAGLFIPKGPVVQVKTGNGKIMTYDSENSEFYREPLIVLLDHLSASASEIFAACMQDYNRAILVGDRETHGKGSVQTIVRLNQYPSLAQIRPGAVKYTNAKYYRISGHSTQQKGVNPDIAFPSFFDFMDIGESKLPHVMEWDEIKPAKYTPTEPNYVKRFLPQLKEKSNQRLANNPAFQMLFDEIKRFGARQSMNEIPLQIDKRRQLMIEDEKWAELTRKVLYREKKRPSNLPKDDKDSSNPTTKEEFRDLILEEAICIMTDFLELIQKNEVTAPVGK